LTAKDSITDKEEGYQAGADSYLTKPFSASLLQSRISNLLTSTLLSSYLPKPLFGSYCPDSEEALLSVAADVSVDEVDAEASAGLSLPQETIAKAIIGRIRNFKFFIYFYFNINLIANLTLFNTWDL
jgi:DNA-binding response OmpR family regulator